MVDVVQEAVERVDALPQALRQRVPFGLRDDARNGVEGNQPLGAGLVAVDGEGDADAVEQQVGLAALLGHALDRRLGEPVGEGAKMRTHLAVGRAHFVVMPAFHPHLPV